MFNLNMFVIALFTLGVSSTFHAWCAMYAALRFLHKSCTLEPKMYLEITIHFPLNLCLSDCFQALR